MTLSETTFILPLVFLISAYALYKLRQGPQRERFPPGPPTKPIIGNLLDFDFRGAWTKLAEYKSFYGDLAFFHGLGMKILVLNSFEAIDDLLEKRPLIYSDRPPLIVAGELMGLNQSAAFMPYSTEWREHRRMANSALSPTATKKYHTRQEDFSALLNLALLNNPEEFIAHVRLTAVRLALSVTYGMSIEEAGGDYIKHAEETVSLIRKVTVPGVYFADLLPISVVKCLLFCVPSPFRQDAARGRAMIDYFLTMPFENVKQVMEEGIAPPSLTKDLLQDIDDDLAMYEHRVKWISGTSYSAGTETIYTVVLTFLLAMALYPEKQKLAQDEIDLVVGTDRVPVITDRESCPYVCALIKETMRWRPTLPLGAMRYTSEDDEYRGYLIPKGTIVIPNTWAVAFEPNGKYDPQSFIPERFLDPDPTNANAKAAVDPGVWAFGYGRRICPGKALAESSLAVLIPSILAAFDILPSADGVLEAKSGSDRYSYPESFKCSIVPRSRKAAELVRKRAAVANV